MPFDLQGHRGARGLWPENTFAGFAGAISLGVSSLEIDIAVTRDGVPVVVHDPVLDPDLTRDAAGAWLSGEPKLVHSLTLAELRGFDVGRARPGSRIAARFPQQCPCDGAGIPTLADVFAATAGVPIDAELKTDPHAPGRTVAATVMADAVLAVARQQRAAGRLTVRSFDWRGLDHLRRAAPDLPLAWLTEAKTDGDRRTWWNRQQTGRTVQEVAAASGAGLGPRRPVWAPDHDGLTAADVAEAHALGLRVVPWTVNRPADMARLIGWGVDGLCTDHPDLARPVLAAAGITPPPPGGYSTVR